MPADDHAGPRLKRIGRQNKMIGLVKRIAPARTKPIPTEPDAFLRAVYPWLFRRAWPTAPELPSALAGSTDLPAELAVRGPFASGLRRVADGRYTLSVEWLAGYPVADGLTPPGGAATLVVRDARLATIDASASSAALLAGLNEQLTVVQHNADVHMTILNPFALASVNALPARHPVRRLLHHCFHTVLIDNVELAGAQLSGPRGFLATIFSHEADVLAG